jgi:hypothetical protein
MATRNVRIVMNGVTGRMGYRQHLLRSVLAIRDDGGSRCPTAAACRWSPSWSVATTPSWPASRGRTTSLTSPPTSTPRWPTRARTVYFDAQVTGGRRKTILTAIAAGKHVYTEKPIAESVEEGRELAQAADSAGIVNGVVHDKLFLPGLLKLKRLLDSGFFGRIMSVRCEFGYWVFPGDVQPAQRPSWNYRAEEGGGIVLDMFSHWSYVWRTCSAGCAR